MTEYLVGMDDKLFKGHFLLFVDLREVLHALVVEFGMGQVQDFHVGQDWGEDIDRFRA